MNDATTAGILIISAIFIAIAWTIIEQRKKERVLRELNRLNYQMTYTANCIEMSRLTTHARNRDDYLNEAVMSARDASEIAINISKEI